MEREIPILDGPQYSEKETHRNAREARNAMRRFEAAEEKKSKRKKKENSVAWEEIKQTKKKDNNFIWLLDLKEKNSSHKNTLG